jgi:hypothetical protein
MANWNPFAGLLSAADPNVQNEAYGVPESDVRMAQAGLLGNLGATLLAAGQRISPATRAQLLGQLGPQMGQFSTDIYNAAQRRYQQGVLAEAKRKQDLAELLAEEELRRKQGEPARMAAAATLQGAMARPTLVATEYEDGQPVKWEGAEQFYTPGMQLAELLRGGFAPSAAEAIIKAGTPTEKKVPAITEAEGRSIIASAIDDPSIADSARYAQAFDAVYGPKWTTSTDQFGNVTGQYVSPPIPQNVPRPTRGARPGEQPTVQPAPTGGGAQVTVRQAPITPEQKSTASTVSEMSSLINTLYSELEPLESAQGVMPGEVKTRIQSGVTAILTKLKDLQKLGALSGSDYDLLYQQLSDPTTLDNIFSSWGVEGARNKAKTQLELLFDRVANINQGLPEGVRAQIPGTLVKLSPKAMEILKDYRAATQK